MSDTRNSVLTRAATFVRGVAAALIRGVARARDFDEVEARIATMPLPGQAALIAGVLGLLFLAAIVAAQFGPAGLLVYFIAVIAIVR